MTDDEFHEMIAAQTVESFPGITRDEALAKSRLLAGVDRGASVFLVWATGLYIQRKLAR